MELQKTLEGPSDSKEFKSVNPKINQPWIFIGRTVAEAPILWPPDAKSQLNGKRSWCWARLRAGREAGNRGWEGWMASPTQWMWVWANTGTGKPGVLQFTRSQRVRHNLATEQQQYMLCVCVYQIPLQTHWLWSSLLISALVLLNSIKFPKAINYSYLFHHRSFH